jgi:hypothetical protein
MGRVSGADLVSVVSDVHFPSPHWPAWGDLMRHALGVHWYGYRRGMKRWSKPYRNYFCAGADDVHAWERLVYEGLAVCATNDDGIYSVTEAGREAALAGIVYSTHHAARWGYGEPEYP